MSSIQYVLLVEDLSSQALTCFLNPFLTNSSSTEQLRHIQKGSCLLLEGYWATVDEKKKEMFLWLTLISIMNAFRVSCYHVCPMCEREKELPQPYKSFKQNDEYSVQ